MKKIIYFLLAPSLVLTACNTNNAEDQKRADSLAAEAAADLMLNSALEADSLDSNVTDSAAVLDTGAVEHLP